MHMGLIAGKLIPAYGGHDLCVWLSMKRNNHIPYSQIRYVFQENPDRMAKGLAREIAQTKHKAVAFDVVFLKMNHEHLNYYAVGRN